jgi:hypothetical protein
VSPPDAAFKKLTGNNCDGFYCLSNRASVGPRLLLTFLIWTGNAPGRLPDCKAEKIPSQPCLEGQKSNVRKDEAL